MSNHQSSNPTLGSSTRVEVPQQAYGFSYWMAYLSNTLLMLAVSLLFRYADFITYLGGDEVDLGHIVGAGMIGAISMRVVLGVGIDRMGPRLVWICSLLLLAASLAAHLAVAQVDGWLIYLARMTMAVGIAGSFGASLTYASLRAPPNRMAEMIGTLGTAGFLGQAIGPILGDHLFTGTLTAPQQMVQLFLWAVGIVLAACLLAVVATHGQVRRRRRAQPPLFALVGRYHPGAFLLVGAAMGIGISLPHTFLRMYCLEEGISGIRNFFLTYSIIAFVVRIATRHFPARFGNRRMIYWGLSSLAVSMLAYLPARNEIALMLPAVFGGVAHAFLFPAVIAGGSSFFPTRYRGLGTTVMLAMFDMGNLLGQPAIGYTLVLARRMGFPPYPTMFALMAFGLIGVAGIFALWPERSKRNGGR